MSNVLNITNGDSAVDIMKQAGIPGEFLPWRDVLHEGPVPQDLSLEALSGVRAQFISERGFGEVEVLCQSFIERDNVLKSYQDYEKVILWFEHDLYDQLQLLQILDWFRGQDFDGTPLSIICTDQYFGRLTPDEMASLFNYEVPVTESQLNLANRAWVAFREQTPEKWAALLKEDTSALEFLAGAVERMIEEFPSRKNGLSRTEQQALKIISEGEAGPWSIFSQNQALEERTFLGDVWFWDLLSGFLTSSPPLLELPEGQSFSSPPRADLELRITPAGKDVLSGQRNWLEATALNRWIGGVHLTPDSIWYSDQKNELSLSSI